MQLSLFTFVALALVALPAIAAPVALPDASHVHAAKDVDLGSIGRAYKRSRVQSAEDVDLGSIGRAYKRERVHSAEDVDLGSIGRAY